MENISIQIINIFKEYLLKNSSNQQSIKVLNGFSLDVKNNDFVAIFGPNGCGKTTLLKVISGLIPADNGQILIKGLPPQHARVGFIFQNYRESIFPWRTVIDNITFSLELMGVSKRIRIRRAVELLDTLKINIPFYSYPYELSGGQQQLVAIAQSLMYEPDVLLLDEPFSALDFQTRLFMQNKILELWGKINIPIIFVSHDIEEAIYLSDKIVLLNKKPMNVFEIFDNPIRRPRNNSTRKSKEFFDFVNYVSETAEKNILTIDE